MNRILFVLSLVLGAVFGVAIQPATENATPQQLAASSTTAGAASQQVQPYNTAAASSPQGNVVPAPFYYPTYPEYNKEAGYSVQTGYEGYLVPAATSAPQSSGWTSGLWSMMYPMSRVALRYGARAGVYFLNLLLLLFLGGIFTTSVCTFTPLCTITLLGLGKAQVSLFHCDKL